MGGEYAELEYESHDDTPHLIHPNSLDLVGYGKGKEGDFWTGYHFENGQFRLDHQHRTVRVCRYSARDMGKVTYPAVPEVDMRTMSNAEFLSLPVQERVRLYMQKHHIFSIFPRLSCSLNINVNYGADTPRAYWDSVYTGNVLEHSKTVSRPRVSIPSDEVEEGSLYTLLMLCPDHPFRVQPEQGHVLHWAVANVKAEGGRVDVAEGGDEVLPYLMPLPSEDAGLLRYIFVLFKQDKKVDVQKLSAEEATLSERRGFFLHQAARPTSPVLHKAIQPVEASIDDEPCAASFFHTSFDYPVMDYYMEHGLDEPMYHPADAVADTVNFQVKDYSKDIANLNPYRGREHRHTGNKWDRSQFDYF
eukprot:TRINITY_DN16162_c0_g1_i2.p1 TRINITY_DN16162_c0_g1~~TRINITY_DN16162_c0_g1_i2.p1  ORF type:complete len:360 (+),score=159.31 TRINITY_DN16162_c0_g1_i2:233-1312(+)